MKAFPFELLVLLVFFAVLLINVVLGKAARRRRAQATRGAPIDEALPEGPWRTPAADLSAATMPEEERAHLRREPAPAAPPPRAPAGKRLRVARQSLFGARWDIQEAVVVATILGRCRADEPHEIR